MSDHCLTTLPPIRKHQLDELADLCRKEEPITLHIPEDGDHYLFTCNDKDLPISCIVICEAQEDLWECYALTHPDYRKKGCLLSFLKRSARWPKNENAILSLSLLILFF